MDKDKYEYKDGKKYIKHIKTIATYGPPDWIDMILPSADKIRSTLHYPEDYPFIKVKGLKCILIVFEEYGKPIAYKLDMINLESKPILKPKGRFKDIGEIYWPLELYHAGNAAYIRMKDGD